MCTMEDSHNIAIVAEGFKRLESNIENLSKNMDGVVKSVDRVEIIAQKSADLSHENNVHLVKLNGAVASNIKDIEDLQNAKNGTQPKAASAGSQNKDENKINPFVDFALVAGKEAVKTKFGRWMLFMVACWVITSCGGCYTLVIEFVNFIGTK